MPSFKHFQAQVDNTCSGHEAIIHFGILTTLGAQWLRHCAINRKVAGSIPDGVIGIFH
jgi:hypothetical protein